MVLRLHHCFCWQGQKGEDLVCSLVARILRRQAEKPSSNTLQDALALVELGESRGIPERHVATWLPCP